MAALRLQAKVSVLVIAVAERYGARLPAAPRRAAGKLANGVQELMAGILFPMRRFSAAVDHNARPQARQPRRRGHRRRQMHRVGNARENAGAVVDQPNQLPMVRLAAQVNDPGEWRVAVFRRADLHEHDASAKTIDDVLEVLKGPLLAREVALAAGVDEPESPSVSRRLLDLVEPRALLIGQVDMAPEFLRAQRRQPKLARR